MAGLCPLRSSILLLALLTITSHATLHMTIATFLSHLQAHADHSLLFQLPDGGLVPSHFHITEIGHVRKRFIDCGGTRREMETCLLQLWVHEDVEHRLLAGKLAEIFSKAGEVLPHHELPVEIEYEDGVVAQFPVESVGLSEGRLVFLCGWKHTDCLARGVCLPGDCAPASAVMSEVCAPGSGCC
jgi:hypothetical protein